MKLFQIIKASFLLILVPCCFSCVSMNKNYTSYGTNIKTLENQANAKVGYKSYSILLQELNEKSNAQMWSPDKKRLETSHLPKGGLIIVKIKGSTIESANTKWWEYVIQDSKGNLIKRQSGDDGIDGIPEHSRRHWWNIDIVYIDQKISGPVKVFVIDKLSNRRSGFLVNI